MPPSSPPGAFRDIVHAAVSDRRSHDGPAPLPDAIPTHSQKQPAPGTPSERTGPPRSISYNYILPMSTAASRCNSRRSTDIEDGLAPEELELDDSDAEGIEFPPANSNLPFRGALEYQDPEQREREREIAARKSKTRDAGYFHDAWNPKKWLTDSPKEEHEGFQFDAVTEGPSSPRIESDYNDLRRSRSMPHIRHDDQNSEVKSEHNPAESKPSPAPRWGRLRSLLPHITSQSRSNSGTAGGPSAVVSQSVNITDELIAGGLSTLMLRLWFERDEKGYRRVPALFHRLRIRVSDSLHPLHGHKAVFRIECEYANGAARWVVYRQLRDFLSLHTHYALSNAYNRNVETLPDFPRTSLPYFKFLKEKNNDIGRGDFARLQREALENYLIGLIRAVMFHPAANRLAGFLEISALSIALAQSGGAQYKAGFLRIEASSTKGGIFGRRSASWKTRRAQKWCAVRESYLVVVEEMGELTVWDVFLIDSEFKIERPKRYYRQGLNMITHPEGEDNEHAVNGDENVRDDESHRSSAHSRLSSFTSHISRAFHMGHHGDQGASLHPDGDVTATPSRQRVFSSDSDSSAGSGPSTRPLTPMLDPSTNTNPLLGNDDHHDQQDMHAEAGEKRRRRSGDVSKHTFYIENSQLRLKLFAHNERQMLQWIAALEKVARESHYTGKNRFDSFAPIRLNVAAQWLVDGRDYFWNLSRAILLARESIYIHDWWLSPELQMRRPNKENYRLDRLLERKAKEGVKIYIILYQEVSSRTTPVDSNYAKSRLTALHPNVMVQRSPSHFQTGTFYWAHHEKLCVIDQAIAFMGGLDLCFGRWDTPQHVLIDDADNPDGSEHIWPGKDYSNPRISDFVALNRPFEDMYDRTKVPRMPWHDVSMQVVGQPARDLARHFVQRWNHLLRIKNHSREMPFLLPPSEFRPGELTEMGLTGTCEFQLCRSAGPWSMGTPDEIEHSIQNAYLKAIQMSEHFVYIENQFFITSTVVNEVKIENQIGDALVHRIIRAHHDQTPWKACILIPSLPGFSFPVDHSDASAIRIILECQNRTISRGPNSIFARLRKEGIDPDDYISFFSLRNWAKLRGDVLTSEQVYIHGKVCIVDDRLAIIGSANINERSQRGDRDSEIAAVIRDTDMIDCTMAGKPFKVGRFAHTLRVRLMREHIGVDVDAMYEQDLMASEPVQPIYEQDEWDPEGEQKHGKDGGVTIKGKSHRTTALGSLARDALDGMEQAIHGSGDVGSKNAAQALRKMGIKSKGLDATAGDASLDEERQTFTREGEKEHGFTSSTVPTLEEKLIAKHPPQKEQSYGASVEDEPEQDENVQEDLPAEMRDANGDLYGAPAGADPQHDYESPHAKSTNGNPDDEDRAPGARVKLRRHLAAKMGNHPYGVPIPVPHVDPHGFEDPICDTFWKTVWLACAVHNTEVFRKVFHAIPDDLVTTWKQYKEFVVHHERLNKPVKDSTTLNPVARVPSESGDIGAPGQAPNQVPGQSQSLDMTAGPSDNDAMKSNTEMDSEGSTTPTASTPQDPDKENRGRKVNRGPEPFDQAERDEMERLLAGVQGHLVVYPTRFLEGEDLANNFLFNADRLLPLPIYD